MSESQVSSKVLTVANLLTFLRMALIPVFAIMLVYHREGWALVVFTVAGVSDGIDGFIARRMKQESELGTIIDPIADKLLMTTAFIMLTIPGLLTPGRHLPVPFWVTAAVIGRDVLIIAVAGAINIMTGFRGLQTFVAGKGKHLCPGKRGYTNFNRRCFSRLKRYLPSHGIHCRSRLRRLFRHSLRFLRRPFDEGS